MMGARGHVPHRLTQIVRGRYIAELLLPIPLRTSLVGRITPQRSCYFGGLNKESKRGKSCEKRAHKISSSIAAVSGMGAMSRSESAESGLRWSARADGLLADKSY